MCRGEEITLGIRREIEIVKGKFRGVPTQVQNSFSNVGSSGAVASGSRSVGLGVEFSENSVGLVC